MARLKRWHVSATAERLPASIAEQEADINAGDFAVAAYRALKYFRAHPWKGRRIGLVTIAIANIGFPSSSNEVKR